MKIQKKYDFNNLLTTNCQYVQENTNLDLRHYVCRNYNQTKTFFLSREKFPPYAAWGPAGEEDRSSWNAKTLDRPSPARTPTYPRMRCAAAPLSFCLTARVPICRQSQYGHVRSAQPPGPTAATGCAGPPVSLGKVRLPGPRCSRWGYTCAWGGSLRAARRAARACWDGARAHVGMGRGAHRPQESSMAVHS